MVPPISHPAQHISKRPVYSCMVYHVNHVHGVQHVQHIEHIQHVHNAHPLQKLTKGLRNFVLVKLKVSGDILIVYLYSLCLSDVVFSLSFVRS